MEPTQFQTSFIPKKALTEERPVRTRPVSLFLFLATILFIASIASAGFVYFTKAGLERGVAGMRSDLDAASAAFEGDFIADLQELDRRIAASKQILDNHISISPIFESLQTLTLKSVQFTKFEYKITGTGASAMIDVKMSGKTDEYESLALQSDALTKNKYFKDPIFSNLNIDEKGNVLFDLTFKVDPNLVLYGEAAKRLQGISEIPVDMNSTNVSTQ